jgi:hypothetical protein
MTSFRDACAQPGLALLEIARVVDRSVTRAQRGTDPARRPGGMMPGCFVDLAGSILVVVPLR